MLHKLKQIAITPEEYLPRFGDLNTENGEIIDTANKYAEVKQVANLPEVSLFDGISDIIRTILTLSMSLTIVAIVVAAIYMMISQGDDEDISKAKKIMLYLVIGMAIMAAAYAFVAGIAQFKFFNET